MQLLLDTFFSDKIDQVHSFRIKLEKEQEELWQILELKQKIKKDKQLLDELENKFNKQI